MTSTSIPERLLENPITFPDGQSFERLDPITDFRKDPNEARILYLCRRRLSSEIDTNDGQSHLQQTGDEYVVKIKIQVPPLSPEHQQTPLIGPSPHTAAELQALKTFSSYEMTGVPQLIASKSTTQGSDGLFPGGYVSYTVMTKMPGKDLMTLGFWSMPEEQREVIRNAFLRTLKTIWKVGFAPYDCALRNVLWDIESQTCSIVDFEHWHDAKDPVNMHETEEMQAWGLAQRPASATWWAEWGIK